MGSKIFMVEKVYYSNAISKYMLDRHVCIFSISETIVTDKYHVIIFFINFIFSQVQFGIVLLHTSINYFSKCTYPKGFDIAFMSYGIFIMILFLNFYRQSYLKSKREAAAKKASKESTKTSNGTNGIGKKHN